MAMAVLRVMVSLAIVLFLAYFSLHYLLPRLQPGRRARPSSLEIIERLPVGMRSYLCLVRVGDKVLLLGISPGAMHLISELPTGSLPEAANLPAPTDFTRALEQSKEKLRQSLSPYIGRFSQSKRGEEDEKQQKDS